MAQNVQEAILNFANGTKTDTVIYGWVKSGKDRGTIDILWSCCLTIFLCCWVATHPNAGSRGDKWYRGFADKFALAMVGFLGPDFLFAIAFGQLSSARRSVKLFKHDKITFKGNTVTWTYTDAFFADMGGIFLISPDYPQGFPITAAQLHYLAKHGHIDFPDMESMNIGERNTRDNLARLLTVWQAVWFFTTEMSRIAKGLPITTLELTALSYVFVMIATEICWLRKPSITNPRTIPTKDGRTITEVRAIARETTHPSLPQNEWYRTPLDFLSGPRWQIDAHWRYYTRLLECVLRTTRYLSKSSRAPLLLESKRNSHKSLNSQCWDRAPSDMWLPAERDLLPFGIIVQLAFSGCFLAAWKFHFPTEVEQILWRVFAVYHAVFSLFGGGYYLLTTFKWRPDFPPQENLRDDEAKSTTTNIVTFIMTETNTDTEQQGSAIPERRGMIHRVWDRIYAFMAKYKNISPDQDPSMELPLKVILPITLLCALYIFSRVYIWVEDFISVRAQPVGTFIAVNRFLPWLGESG